MEKQNRSARRRAARRQAGLGTPGGRVTLGEVVLVIGMCSLVILAAALSYWGW